MNVEWQPSWRKITKDALTDLLANQNWTRKDGYFIVGGRRVAFWTGFKESEGSYYLDPEYFKPV